MNFYIKKTKFYGDPRGYQFVVIGIRQGIHRIISLSISYKQAQVQYNECISGTYIIETYFTSNAWNRNWMSGGCYWNKYLNETPRNS